MGTDKTAAILGALRLRVIDILCTDDHTAEAVLAGEAAMNVPIFVGAGAIEYQERPVPRLVQPDDVLVRVEACGICGTDLNILAVPPAHKATPGIIIGHEGVGIVAEVGPAVSHVRPGDRVVIANRLTCGKCAYCRRGLDNQCTDYQTIGTTLDGAFAPYLRAPARPC